MTPKVLISDALSTAAVQIFKDRGVDVDFQPNLGKDKDKLAAIINGFDGLAIRSATKVTAKILEHATGLKVIGRAGIGVDNVDIPAATAKGVIVMNTPFGNSITTAEHAITLMLALARQIRRPMRRHRPASGEEPVHGCRDHRQDAGRHRLRQYRDHRGGACARAENEGDLLRSLSFARTGHRSRRREGGARRAAAPVRLHHPAYSVDGEDQEHHRRGRARALQERRTHHQLRAWRLGGRAGAARGTRFRSGQRRRLRRVHGRAGNGQSVVRTSQCRVHAAPRRVDQ